MANSAQLKEKKYYNEGHFPEELLSEQSTSLFIPCSLSAVWSRQYGGPNDVIRFGESIINDCGLSPLSSKLLDVSGGFRSLDLGISQSK